MKDIEKILSNIKSIGYFLGSPKDAARNTELHNEIKEKEGKVLTSDIVDLKLSDLEHNLSLLQNEFTNIVNQQKINTEKEKINVAIVSVIPKEFDALNKVFDFKKHNKPSSLQNGLSIWKNSVQQEIGDKKNLNLLFAQIGNAGNLSSYVITDLLLKKFEIDLIILCGIAAGNSKKVKIYSSIIGERVIYYESQKLVPGEQEYRLEPLSITPDLRNEIQGIDIDTWREKFLALLKNTKNSITKKELAKSKWINSNWKKNTAMKIGGILAGEKLLADRKTIAALVKKVTIGKDIVAGEMEGYGFAYACKQNRHLNWLIFRGISDYGGPEKSTRVNDKYQIIAALAGASLIRDYLENYYRPENHK